MSFKTNTYIKSGYNIGIKYNLKYLHFFVFHVSILIFNFIKILKQIIKLSNYNIKTIKNIKWKMKKKNKLITGSSVDSSRVQME